MLPLIFLIFSVLPAFGQGDDSFTRNERSWPVMKEEMTSTLKPGSSVYSLPEFAVNPDQNLSVMPWNYWRERCTRSASAPALKGRLLFKTEKFAAIRLDQPGNFCGSYFNDGSEDRAVVFVPLSAVASTVPRGEEVTEALAADPNCPECKNDPALEVLRAMARSAASRPPRKRCQKTDAELEKYLACHATENQSNYNRYYKKLFNIAGRTFMAAYTPGHGVKAVLKPEDTQVQPIPFVVGARAKVMKCIGLRESLWDPKRVSSSGAMGLGQQTNTNVEHINCMLNGCKRGKEIVKPTKWAQQLWKEYFRRVKAELSVSEQAELFTHPKTGKRCSETMQLKERDAPCPINSIAAMALYQIEAELTIRRTTPLYRGTDMDFNEDERCDLEIVQGATNNAGTGTVQGAVSGGGAPSQWRARLRDNTPIPGHGAETDQFSKYIRNCLQAGNMDSMHPPAPGKKASDCSRYSR
jgi:hypothetical protein